MTIRSNLTQKRCRHCATVVDAEASYCPKCRRLVPGTVDHWREYLLKELRRLQQNGWLAFEWIGYRCCQKCEARSGKRFTADQLVSELSGEFCSPSDPDDRCSCSIGPVQNSP